MKLVIKKGRVVDPASGTDEQLDVLIQDGIIHDLQKNLTCDRFRPDKEINAEGCIVTPGLIDMHTHLREPGHEYKETIQTGTRAAAAGGFTTVVCMANTQPVNDNASVTRYILDKARHEGCVTVLPVGALTRGLQGTALTEMGELQESGVIALSDDGVTIRNSELMRRALEYARTFSLPVICHCEDHALSEGGVMHEGITSMHLGMSGIPPAAEDTVVARDIFLAEWTGHRIHIAHTSTSGAVRAIREAKARGVAVTAETAPHYFTLTDRAVRGFDTSTKVNPPLRTEQDVAAVKEGLQDGTIDAIASDHAPHSSLEKNVEFNNAAFGMIGLETSLPLTLCLVHDNVLSLSEAIAKLTINPARILNIDRGHLRPGAVADVTIIDTACTYTVDRDSFVSKSKNSPFHGRSLCGRAVYTLVAGNIVYPFSA